MLKVNKLSTSTTTALTMVIKKALESFYLSAEVLEKIRQSGLYHDSKTFVDMPLKVDYSAKLQKKILECTDPKDLLKILHCYFEQPGVNELMKVNLEIDSHPEPKFISNIKDPEYKSWAMHLCKIWSKLVRRVNPELLNRQDNHSLIYLEKPFVIPGGRFREVYYWDTYWSILGLLHSEMFDIVKGILENLLSLVERYGFVPNGGRKYYENRSQPPFLTLMVKAYYDVTKDIDFVKSSLPTLMKEHDFWMEQRSVLIEYNNKLYTMNRYNVSTDQPRPESFKEDLETMEKAGHHNDKSKQTEIYSNLASAAESGWDFSSRWLKESHKLETIVTRDIVPVDLNSVLCAVEFTLSDLYQIVATDDHASQKYSKMANKRLSDIDELFWNEQHGLWCDFDLPKNEVLSEYYASVFFPIWIFSTYAAQPSANLGRAFEKVKSLGVLNYCGGLPTSLIESGQQWDFPNVWPPLQHIAVESLDPRTNQTSSSEQQEAGKNLAKQFIENAYISWKTTGHMYEKYDVREYGKAGHGGEYDVQEGFGWTNGVILDFLSKYGHELSAPKINTGKE